MENFQSQKIFSRLFLPFLFHFSSIFLSAADYTLPEQYFINCGSASNPTVYGRTFTGDQNTRNLAFSSGGSSPADNPASSPVEIYQTARIFTKKASYYELNIPEKSTYVVRFHFFPFPSLGNLSNARFSVSASGFSLLPNFSIQNTNLPLIEEFLLTIRPGKFRIDFVPEENSFAFINAMEIFLAPPNFTHDSPPLSLITKEGNMGNFDGSMSGPLRVIHRINVGGENIMPNNDTLLRNWIPDDNYLFNRNSARNSTPYGPKPNYQTGGATEYDAPDFVYRTAKQMNIDNTSGSSNNFNISWRFNVRTGADFLVRLHFCDIVSRTTNEDLRFNLFIYSRFGDMIRPYYGFPQLATPFWIDYVVRSDDWGFMNISVGPRSDSSPPNAFLNGVEIMELVSGSSMGRSSMRKRLSIIIGFTIGGVVLVLVGLVVFVFVLKKKKTKPVEAFDLPLGAPGSLHSRTTDKSSYGLALGDLNLGLRLPFSEILKATKNFDPKLRIGEGGFGKVYKGMLKDGTKVAVKRSQQGHGQGLPEFQTEILILSKIRHQNLVSLIGYCDEGEEMILVYEFMEKGTLRDHLYVSKGDESEGSNSRSELSWAQRLGICIGAAKGIDYLHTGSDRAIIHRDIKSTNILLDEHYVAKVADFGLSRSGPPDQSYVTTEVKGSFGYLDPEYFRCLQLTQKSDVYSFGVVLLEVLCARPAIGSKDQMNLADWGLSWQRKGELEKIVDPVLAGKINSDSLRKFGETVEKCLQENGADRPNMVDVFWDLEYCLKLQDSGLCRGMYDDSTTEFLPLQALQRLPSQSIVIDEDEMVLDSYSFSDASQANASEVFSQLNIDGAR